MAAAPPAPAKILARFPNAVFPVDGRYSFIDDWHAPRKGHLHMGIDIAAANGTPVVAVMDGHISSMDHAGAGGIELFLTTARGDSFLYCHFSRYAQGLHVGQKVQAGQVIAYVGATGDATGPHLHFEIHPGGGAAINPYPYLQAWRAAGDPAAAPGQRGGNESGRRRRARRCCHRCAGGPRSGSKTDWPSRVPSRQDGQGVPTTPGRFRWRWRRR